MGILTKERYNNYGTMAERVEGDDEGVWMDGDEEPPYDLRALS